MSAVSLERQTELLRGKATGQTSLDIAHTAMRVVARRFGVPIAKIRSVGRDDPNVIMARKLAMYVARKASGEALSYPRLGLAFRRDHTTVMYSVQWVERVRSRDPEIQALVDEIVNMVAVEEAPMRCGRATDPACSQSLREPNWKRIE